MQERDQSMTNRTLNGLFWMSLATGANVVSLLLVVLVLARLLTPADFGLAAAALMVIGFSAIFSEFGIGPAVVQRPELRTAHLRSGFTLSLVLGVLLGAMLWAAAPAVAGFFRLEQLTPILRVLAVIFPLQSFGVIADSLLQRELRFRCLAVLEMVAVVVGYGAVGITLAALGFGPWALVGAHLTQTLLKTALMLVVRPHPAWPLLDRRACGELLYFGGGFTASRFSNYLAGQGEHLVIGRCLGAVALGVYGRAYQLMAAPAVLFGNVLDRVLFPAMVQIQDQPKRLAEAYRRCTALIALVIFPLSALLVLLAPEVVLVLLGPDWQAVTLPLQILGVGMLFRTGCKISDSLVRATGAVYRRTWRQTAYAVAVIAGAWVGQQWGLEGVAVAVLVTLALNFFLMAQLGLCLAEMSWRTFGAAHLPGLILAALVAVPVAITAAALRTWECSPLLVLGGSLAAVLPCLLLVRRLPGPFLGEDGKWMARKLRTFLFPAAQPQLQNGNAPMGDVLPANAVAATADSALATSPPGGGPLRRLIEGLAAEQVRYCRWKVHLDLQRVLNGKGDLDLLVDAGHVDAFVDVAERAGFKRAVSCFEPSLAHEMHLFGLDPETGALLHLHVNFSLAGEGSRLRNLVPSLDELVLQHCSPCEVPAVLEGMPVVQPRAQIVVVVLLAMEQYARLRAYPRLARQKGALRAKLQALLAADPEESWKRLLPSWLPSVQPELFAECLAALQQPTSWLRRFRLARRLRSELWSAGGSAGRAPRWGLCGLLGAVWHRLRHGRANPRQLPSGGAVIAFVGPDASGKSTMVAETTRWLGKVFRVQSAHLGKPPSTWLTLVPNLLLRLLRVLAPRLRTSRQDVAADEGKGGSQGLLYRLRAVLLAWDRRALALRLSRKAERGWLIVCDRYPSPVIGAPDSARVKAPEDEPRQSSLRSFLARLENRLYRTIPPPDIVLRLIAPVNVAVTRNEERQKPGKESSEFVARRHKIFFLPHFPNARTVELDTNMPRAETAQRLRQLLWELLGGRAATTSPVRVRLPDAVRSLRIGQDSIGHPERSKPLVVEFIGVTGVGKSTLLAAVAESLSLQGHRVCQAEEVILARYGLSYQRHPKFGSALVHMLSLDPFWRYLCTRNGLALSRLALRSITRGMGSLWTGFGLLRNFLKRIGFHLLLEQVRNQLHDCDILLCDEGVVHAAHNLFVHMGAEPNRDEIVRFGQLVPKPDQLVWVTAPPAQSAEVILRRGHSRVPGTSAAALAFAEHAQATFEVLSTVAGLQEKIYRVDNSATGAGRADATIRARASAVGEFLKQCLRGSQASVNEVVSLTHPSTLNTRTA
jgi:PST family polysaccharide transporter